MYASALWKAFCIYISPTYNKTITLYFTLIISIFIKHPSFPINARVGQAITFFRTISPLFPHYSQVTFPKGVNQRYTDLVDETLDPEQNPLSLATQLKGNDGLSWQEELLHQPNLAKQVFFSHLYWSLLCANGRTNTG